jgi:serine/threonine protein kinase
VKTRTQESLGRYQIEAEIGRGAMGVVYRARDPKIDRLVAIKTISLAGQEPQDEQEYRERFLQEARAAGRLSHPGIVTIYDAGEDPETHEPFLVMEYISGQPLNKILPGADRKLPVETALHFALEIAEALDYAHSQGVIHRDIKPANILVTEDGHAKIADFGVARLNHTLATHTGEIFGSPAYMAPEQLTRGHADARSDLFSVGVMLYSMITGFRPFQGNSAETVCFKVMNVEPVPVTSFQTEVHPGLDRIVSRAIAKDPDERYQRGAELARDIREFLTSNNIPIETNSPLPAWATQTTRQLGLHPGEEYFKQFLWRAGAAALVVAALLTGWQVRKDMREAAEIQPPPAQVQSAPAIQKTPPVVRRPHPMLLRVKKTEQTPRVRTARIHVEILHHFAAGKASILLDNQIVLDENLHIDTSRHPLLRSLEMDQTANVEVSVGKHQVQVHVVSPDNTYDESEMVEANLAPGSRHVLRVNCDKRKMQIALQPAVSSTPAKQ